MQRQKIHKLREYQFADEQWEAQRLKTPVSQNAFKSVTFPKSVFLFYTSTLPYTLSKIAGQQ